MNFQEIKDILIEKVVDEDGDFESPVNLFLEIYRKYQDTFGKIELVQSKGGPDKGSDYQRVFHFVDHNVFIRFSGWYSSYEGASFDNGWDCMTEVQPQQEVITVYK